MNMSIWNLTLEKIQEIEKLIEKLKVEIELLESKTESQIWKDDIEEFLIEFDVKKLY